MFGEFAALEADSFPIGEIAGRYGNWRSGLSIEPRRDDTLRLTVTEREGLDPKIFSLAPLDDRNASFRVDGDDIAALPTPTLAFFKVPGVGAFLRNGPYTFRKSAPDVAQSRHS
jgi:hypothetical protein